MALERKLGYTATGTGLVGAGLLIGPERTPQDWTFIHQHMELLHDLGWGLLGITLLFAIAAKGMKMKDESLVDADLTPTVIPNNPGDVAAGRRYDRYRAKRKPFRW